MPRAVVVLSSVLLLAGCTGYYGGAPGYAANGRPTLSQLALAPGDPDNHFRPRLAAQEAPAALPQ